MSETTVDPKDTFAKFGRNYQERVTQALMQDALFAEQMADVLVPGHFELGYLRAVVGNFYGHKRKFKTYPSPEMLEVMVKQDESADELTREQAAQFLGRTRQSPLNGDAAYVQATALEFCRKQVLKEAFIRGLDLMESGDYDSIQTVIKDALVRGTNRDLGHEYIEGFGSRSTRSIRRPIPTGWSVVDKELNGGWERGTLTTFIAPTGAGKSMFLVNVGAAAIAQGLNVAYVTCEMADYKIGIRFDSYFTGIPISDVPAKQGSIERDVREKVKGRLFIKEFSTKTASVTTIRAYLQRLAATKSFVPDVLIVDYADLLRGTRSYGEKRHELEGIYEELRALAQELGIVVVTADQTNRGGLEAEVVTLASIAEAYAKATVCDLIFTISRRMEDKQTNSGRLFWAKSRLGRDGMVYPFVMNSATVKVTILGQGEDPIAAFLENQKNLQQLLGDRAKKLGPRAG